MTTRIDRRFAEAASRRPPGARHLFHGRRPGLRDLAGDPEGAAGGRRRRHRARHAVLRPDGRRPGDPGGRPARAEGRPDAGARRCRWCATSASGDDDTPIVLMGYYNPIYIYGVDRFLADALAAGVDGLIVVDLPPEVDDELCIPALEAGHQLHPPGDADDRRQAPADGAREHLRLRLLRLDDRHHRRGAGRHRQGRRRRSSASRRTPTCRSASASASRPPSRPRAIGASADGVVVGTAIVNAVANVLGAERRDDRRPGRGRRHAGHRLVARRARRAPCCRRINLPPSGRRDSGVTS